MEEQGRTEDIFEREWRETFEGAEQAPPRIVWSEISGALATEKAIVYKQKAIYYRWAAAAVFLLATSIGLFQMLGSSRIHPNTIASVEIDNPMQLAEETLVPIIVPNRSNSGIDGNPPSGNNSFFGDTNDGNNLTLSNSIAINDQEEVAIDNQIAIEDEKPLRQFVALKPDIPLSKAKLVDQIYRMPNTIYKATKRKKSLDDKYFAGVDFGSSTFNPNFQSGSGASIDNSLALNNTARFSSFNSEALDANSPAVREKMEPGQSFSFGLNLGMKLSEKWSIQSGLQYTKSQATNTTNVVVSSTSILNPIAVTSQLRDVSPVRRVIQNDEVVEYSFQDVDLNNEFQFASIPINAGYMLINRRFSLELKAGLAANLYLGNKLTDPDNQLAEVTIGPGSNSPYKELSFLGLAGIQFGYEFINRFNLIIEPNYRRSLDDVTKGSSEFVSTPSGFGLQTGIRYNFN